MKKNNKTKGIVGAILIIILIIFVVSAYISFYSGNLIECEYEEKKDSSIILACDRIEALVNKCIIDECTNLGFEVSDAFVTQCKYECRIRQFVVWKW